MNLLYILQQSVYSGEGKWVTGDSNLQMLRGLLIEMGDKKPDWNWYILIGKLEDFDDITSYDEYFPSKSNVHFIEYPFPVNAFTNRYHFSMPDFERVWNNLPEIDIVWNNITEQSRNIKTFLWSKGSKAKLVTSCYWLDTPYYNDQGKVDREISYFWRQFDGFECSDLVTFTCNSTKKAWIENSKQVFRNDIVDDIVNKSTIFDFGFSQKELKSIDNTTIPKFDKKTIIFVNRMSGINYTHHLEFIDAVNKLYETRQDFQVVFANPSQKVLWQWLKENVKPLHIYKESYLTRGEYISLLKAADISVHLFTKELYGGCSFTEAFFCDNLIVAPKLYEYAEVLGSDYLYYADPGPNDKFETLDTTLNYALNCINNNDVYATMGHHMRNNKKSYEVVSSTVIEALESLI